MSLTKRDMDLSRQMKRLAKKVDRLVTKELGERHLVGLVIQPFNVDGTLDTAEFQYISNAPRTFMHRAFRALVEKWDAGIPSVPPHERS